MAIVDEWRTRHFAQVPAHGLTHEPLAHAAEVFFEFLKLPEPTKESICKTLKEDASRIDLGYMRRSVEKDADGEAKAYFHYHPDVEVLFAKEIAAAGEPAKHFMEVARDVWERALEIGRDSISEFETEWPGITARFFPKDKTPHLVIRFLGYVKRVDGDFLARAHYDRGTMTIALGESAPGLRIGTPQSLTPVEHKEGQVIIMPGTNFCEDIDPTIVPAWHDVVQSKSAAYSNDTARWAIVGFFDIENSSFISLSKTHDPRS